MRFFILSAMALLGAGSVSAQTYQELSRFEMGVNGGMARISLPQESLYKGQTTYWRPYGAVKALYTFKEYFQVGLEINGSKWESSDDHVPITGLYGKPLGTDTVHYVYAKTGLSFLAQANAIIPVFKSFRYNNVANIHLGISGGPVAAINDGAVGVKEYAGGGENARMQYLNNYDFQPGSGWAFGFQAGYTHYIKEHVGIGVEYAPRFYRINTLDASLAGRNNQFTLWSHALSISVRYRW